MSKYKVGDKLISKATGLECRVAEVTNTDDGPYCRLDGWTFSFSEEKIERYYCKVLDKANEDTVVRARIDKLDWRDLEVGTVFQYQYTPILGKQRPGPICLKTECRDGYVILAHPDGDPWFQVGVKDNHLPLHRVLGKLVLDLDLD